MLRRAGTVGSFATRYWKPTFLPVFAPAGGVEFVLHGAVDVTSQMRDGKA